MALGGSQTNENGGLALSMKDFIAKTVKQFVDNPDDVFVNETQDQSGTLVTLSVNQNDMGKVIGKSGRVIKALRDLLHVKGVKAGLKVSLQLQEPTP